jgi:chemotaxis protein CheD
MKPRQTFVKVAHHATGGAEDLLVTLGLGSCVAICVHDRVARVGGLAHVLLPEPALARDQGNPAKFASTAVPLLLEELKAAGGRVSRMEARLVGGASMFTSLMGERNIRAARAALEKAGIPILGEAVGADYGRSVRFTPAEGRTLVTSVGRPDVVL